MTKAHTEMSTFWYIWIDDRFYADLKSEENLPLGTILAAVRTRDPYEQGV